MFANITSLLQKSEKLGVSKVLLNWPQKSLSALERQSYSVILLLSWRGPCLPGGIDVIKLFIPY
jgi:hypothetical protein